MEHKTNIIAAESAGEGRQAATGETGHFKQRAEPAESSKKKSKTKSRGASKGLLSKVCGEFEEKQAGLTVLLGEKEKIDSQIDELKQEVSSLRQQIGQTLDKISADEKGRGS